MLRVRVEDEYLRKYLFHSFKTFVRPGMLSRGNILDKLWKVKLPRFADKWEDNLETIHEIMSSFLPELERWRSLKQEIKETDREIDRIVYDLYGLTDEEIEIVESSIGNDDGDDL